MVVKGENNGVKISILDRNDKRSRCLMNWLHELDFIKEVKLFEKESEFMEQVVENSPDGCIIRLGLTGISGLRIADAIQKTDHTIRIIFIADHPYYAIDAYEIGAHGYLLSPVDKIKLLNCLGYRRR
jgi:two-component SAPR family response regulator